MMRTGVYNMVVCRWGPLIGVGATIKHLYELKALIYLHLEKVTLRAKQCDSIMNDIALNVLTEAYQKFRHNNSPMDYPTKVEIKGELIYIRGQAEFPQS